MNVYPFFFFSVLLPVPTTWKVYIQLSVCMCVQCISIDSLPQFFCFSCLEDIVDTHGEYTQENGYYMCAGARPQSLHKMSQVQSVYV